MTSNLEEQLSNLDVDDKDSISALIEQIGEAELKDEYKNLNPYGRMVEGSDKYSCFSFINLREEYMTKLLTTSMIGFIYRMCDEYNVPDTAYIKPAFELKEEDFRDVSTELPEDYAPGTATEEPKANQKRRLIIREFLDTIFQYNPDIHVRSAHTPNPSDPERKPLNLRRRKNNQKGPTRRAKQARNKFKPEFVRKKDDGRPPDPKDVEDFTRRVIPPADTFARFARYRDSNYEELRDAVKDIFGLKPDLETALCIYKGDFSSEKKASEFIETHRDNMVVDIMAAKNSSWILLGPFKQNRDRINYYNENVRVLQQIIEQREADLKMGKQLTMKRISNKRKQNEKETGKRAEGILKNYRSEMGIDERMKSMGADSIDTAPINPEAHDQPHPDLPDDAVQINVHHYSHSKPGEGKMEALFIEAEEPKPTE